MTTVHHDALRAVNGVLLPGFTGTDAPAWVLAACGEGLAGVVCFAHNTPDVATAARLSARLHEVSPDLLVTIDEEGGDVSRLEALTGSSIPGAAALGTVDDEDLTERVAFALGRLLAATGVDLDLAPVLDLDDGPSGGVIGDRSFSADPAVASRYGLAYAAGLADAGVTPTVKHFPGHGRSRVDSHRESAVVAAGLDELAASDLVPFRDAIAAGAPVVMLNHLQYAALDPDLPASLSPRAYALLREMGFTGVAITDSVGMGAVNLRWDFPEAAVRAVEAGADAVLATDGAQAVRMRDALVEAVRSGRVPEQRLSQAAARVTALAGGDPVAMSCLDVELPAPSR